MVNLIDSERATKPRILGYQNSSQLQYMLEYNGGKAVEYGSVKSSITEIDISGYIRKTMDEFHKYEMLQDIRNVDEVSLSRASDWWQKLFVFLFE